MATLPPARRPYQLASSQLGSEARATRFVKRGQRTVWRECEEMLPEDVTININNTMEFIPFSAFSFTPVKLKGGATW